MTTDEILQTLSERGAFIAPPCDGGKINLINLNLQRLQVAVLPAFMIELYKKCGGLNLGSGYVFGPDEFQIGNKHPVPGIFEINQELTNIAALRGKTVFGRNDLFWFAFDSFGKCMMLDNIGLKVLRKYDDPYRAIFECLIGGKI